MNHINIYFIKLDPVDIGRESYKIAFLNNIIPSRVSMESNLIMLFITQ